MQNKKKAEIQWWLVATLMIGAYGVFVIITNDIYNVIFKVLSQGLIITIWVSILSFFIASLVGLLLAIGSKSSLRIVREFCRFYVEIIRGIPVLVLLFYVAFVLAPMIIDGLNLVFSLPIERDIMSPFHVRDFEFVWRAILALTISYSAFISEIFRAGIDAVEEGQVEAAKALGLKRWPRFYKVVLPQAIRTILPPLGNDFVAMIKDSSLVSALGVMDITLLGKVYSSGSFRFTETYDMVAFMYLVMTIGLSLLVRKYEKHMKAEWQQK